MNVRPAAMKDVRQVTAIGLWVRDLEPSAAFYRDVIGVPLEYSEPHPPENVPHYETMWGEWDERGPVEPFLWFNLFASSGLATTGAHLSFPVPSIDEVHDRAVAAGVKVVHEPQAGPWGRSAAYEDPDGNVASVTER